MDLITCYNIVRMVESVYRSIHFRPHRSTTYVDAAYCYRPCSVVCRWN